MRRIFRSGSGIVGLALCLAGGLAWLLFVKPSTPGTPVENIHAPTPVASNQRSSAHPIADSVRESFGSPNETDSIEHLFELARSAVARSPQEAIAWANGQENPAVREKLLFAVIREWGRLDPRGALDWVFTQSDEPRLHIPYVFAGAAINPEQAVQLARELIAGDSENADFYGTALVGSLGDAGEFKTALDFVMRNPEGLQTNWLETTFSFWGGNKPADAVKELESIKDPELRTAAFRALVTSWAVSQDPATLAKYAVALPSGEDRQFALTKAFDNWSLQNPTEMGEWLNSIPASPELDHAIAQLVTRTDSVNRSPEVAMSWIEGISSPTLRHDSALHVMKEWVQADPTAAWDYFKKAGWIKGAEREAIQQNVTAFLNTPPRPEPD